MIRIICIGKKHDAMYHGAIAHFEKRLHMYTKHEWLILPHSSLEDNEARNEESARILSRLKPDDYVLLLDEAGVALTNTEIAQKIETAQNRNKSLVCIIGGSHGVNEALRNRADVVVAFGRVAFPHQLMRVLVLEQLYRGYSILAGSGYHHE